MPLYDYQCQQCLEVFEAHNSVSNRGWTVCPKCSGEAMHVILTAPMMDPRMGLDPSFPSAAAKWRAAAIRRARGEDMTAANKTIETESIDREAHAQRAAAGKGRVTVS